MSILKQNLDDFTTDDKGVFNCFTLESNQNVRGRQDFFLLIRKLFWVSVINES